MTAAGATGAGPPAADAHEVFNRRRTVGVRAVRGGATVGVYLDETVRAGSERELAREIVTVAAVAAMRGRLALREHLEEAARTAGTAVPAGVFGALPDLPTLAQYEDFRRRALQY